MNGNHRPAGRSREIVDEIFHGRDIFGSFAGGIAQLVERLVRNEKARGSNPLTSKGSHNWMH
jgi:S-adenosylmethionine hydrolase